MPAKHHQTSSSLFKRYPFLACISAWMMLPAHANINVAQECYTQAKTSLENVYCDIKSEGEGTSLPDLSDFRRNSVRVQVLLLKRPAGKLGIALPANLQNKQKKPASSTKTQDESFAFTTPTKPPLVNESPNKQPGRGERNRDSYDMSSELSACSLRKNRISCRHETFELVNNIPNHLLSPYALDADNQLVIPTWDTTDNQTEADYLVNAYQLYIDKMMEIGLGAVTMSFTSFHHIYYELRPTKAEFTRRFEVMFEYLKSDKKSMLTPRQIAGAFPSSTNQCNFLRSDLVVCDNGFHNWLYQKIE